MISLVMRRFPKLFLLWTCWIAGSESFSVLPHDARTTLMPRFAEDTADTPPAEAMQPADLVNGKAFRAAIETLKVEMAKEQGIAYEAQDMNAPTSQPTLIGRVNVELPIPPEIELVETPTMVLVQRLSVKAQEAGINPLDTIVSVSTMDGTFQENVKQMDLESMGPILNDVITTAMEKGDTEIKLELNRLIQGYYAEEPINPPEGDETDSSSSAAE